MKAIPAKEIWELLPGESAKHFAAFCAYRDLGPKRALHAAALACGTTVITVAKWSHKHDWVERATAYDEHLDRLRRADEEKDMLATARAMRERHANLALLVQERVVLKLTSMTEADIKGLSPSDVISWLAKSAALEAVARGDAPSNKLDVTISSAPIVVGVRETIIRSREDLDKAKKVVVEQGCLLLDGQSDMPPPAHKKR